MTEFSKKFTPLFTTRYANIYFVTDERPESLTAFFVKYMKIGAASLNDSLTFATQSVLNVSKRSLQILAVKTLVEYLSCQ